MNISPYCTAWAIEAWICSAAPKDGLLLLNSTVWLEHSTKEL